MSDPLAITMIAASLVMSVASMVLAVATMRRQDRNLAEQRASRPTS